MSGRVTSSSTRLEEYTAIIADRMFEEWCAATFAEMVLREHGVSLQNQLTLIKRDIDSAMDNYAAFMTGTSPSPEKVCRIIEDHLSRLRPELLEQGYFNCAAVWMFLLEQKLRLSLCPWFDIRLSKPYKQTESAGGHRLSVQLLCPKTGQILAGKACSISTLDLLRLEHAKILQKFYDRQRMKILDQSSVLMEQGQHGEHDALKAAMFRYRKVLETGDWSTVPVIRGWSLQPLRVQSLLSVYKSILEAMRATNNRNWERDLGALSADQKKAEQEQKALSEAPNPSIQALFDQLAEQGLSYTHDSSDPDPEAEEFSRIRNRKKPNPELPRFEDMKHELDAPGTVIRAMFISPDEPRDKVRLDILSGGYKIDPALISAINHSNEQETRRLLESGADTEVIDDVGSTPLQLAALRGSATIVRLLLDHKADMTARVLGPGNTILQLAVSKQHLDVVKLLLEHGAEVDTLALRAAVSSDNGPILELLLSHYPAGLTLTLDSDKTTLLHHASLKGIQATAKVLLSAGAPLEARDSTGSTPLHLAAESGHSALASLLLDSGASVHAQDSKLLTPLHKATNGGHTPTMALLLSHHAAVDAAVEGLTPLHVATLKSDEASIALLLNSGANPNSAFPNGGATALHIAVGSDKLSLLELLLRKGADPNPKATIPKGQTPLHIAALDGKMESARTLLGWGADVDAAYEGDGQTPLHVAAARGGVDMVGLLVTTGGADFGRQTGEGDTAFSLAAMNRHQKVAEVLLERGSGRMTDRQKKRGLVMAARGNLVGVVARLLDMGVPVDGFDEVGDTAGCTALHMAALFGHEELAGLLMGRGADVGGTNYLLAATPVQLAQVMGHLHIVRLLEGRLSSKGGGGMGRFGGGHGGGGRGSGSAFSL
ncbi:ankyrin repeat-containing domain protein [Ilyonectria destructans]|nr:ankyrin repeat-containing domain protein [Ilyonectria destructans]